MFHPLLSWREVYTRVRAQRRETAEGEQDGRRLMRIGQGVRLGVMRRLISLVAVALLLSVASPVFACMTELAMTPAERACCKRMHGNCNEMPGHQCCQLHLHGDLSQAPVARTNAPLIVFSPAEAPAAFYPEVRRGAELLAARESERPPPLLTHLSTIVLRI